MFPSTPSFASASFVVGTLTLEGFTSGTSLVLSGSLRVGKRSLGRGECFGAAALLGRAEEMAAQVDGTPWGTARPETEPA